MPHIFGADGVSRIDLSARTDIEHVRLSSNFDLNTGLGTVRLYLPSPHLERLQEVILMVKDGIAGIPGMLEALPLILTELQTMLQPSPVDLLPAQAEKLGLRLLLESEAAIGNAILMRTLLEIGGMSAKDAVTIAQNVGLGTREAHVLVLQKYAAEAQRRRQQQMTEEAAGTPQ